MTRRCEYCPYVTEDDAETACPHDYAPLVPSVVTAEAGGAVPIGTGPPGPGTRTGRTLLRLTFGDGDVVEVEPGTDVRLGRDPAWSPHADLLAPYGHMSRRHATVGLRESGTAWILVEPGTRNDTYAGDDLVEPGRRVALADGCVLRLSRRVPVRVTIELPR
ncbi:hypothetical protein GCM10009677_02130 [Sphaerisporangium rubeum]|uniref:FHA domain-containing protein n=1 Tax=Sphaerisporangium rubeum TaxID=321317 RepID=A0A7X0M7L5_9ACTN|nr:FHA domain-containing protein [Sphaerisporangium rubeum]MBB6473164.1 hypothetical protein [Sphaerisporangium rubeum]